MNPKQSKIITVFSYPLCLVVTNTWSGSPLPLHVQTAADIQKQTSRSAFHGLSCPARWWNSSHWSLRAAHCLVKCFDQTVSRKSYKYCFWAVKNCIWLLLGIFGKMLRIIKVCSSGERLTHQEDFQTDIMMQEKNNPKDLLFIAYPSHVKARKQSWKWSLSMCNLLTPPRCPEQGTWTHIASVELAQWPDLIRFFKNKVFFSRL